MYIGNRGDSTICAIAETTLQKGACGTLDSAPDGIAYVGATSEVWVTTPRDTSIRILDAKTLVQKAKLQFAGEPEGFAVDPVGHRFFTNLEDRDETLAIDTGTRATTATWKPACGPDGPHGLRFDARTSFLFVACTSKIETLDAGHDGAVLGSVDTGDGVDDFDYDAATHVIYAGASHAATLTTATVDARGALARMSVTPTAEGARNGIVDASGRVYLSHSSASEILVVKP